MRAPDSGQVLEYLLIDRHNALYLEQIALYLGWQALLLVVSAEGVLRVSTASPTPALESVRAAFADALREDIASGAHWQLAKRYPMPSEAIT